MPDERAIKCRARDTHTSPVQNGCERTYEQRTTRIVDKRRKNRASLRRVRRLLQNTSERRGWICGDDARAA